MNEEIEFFEDIVRMVRLGQANDAANRLFRKKGGRFERYYQRRGFSVADSEELTAELIFKVVTAKPPQEGRAAAWLWKVAENLGNSQISKAKAQMRGGDEYSEITLPDEAWGLIEKTVSCIKGLSVDLADCVAKSMARFESERPERYEAAYFKIIGLSPGEFAEIKGKNPPHDKQVLNAATKQMSSALEIAQEYLKPCF